MKKIVEILRGLILCCGMVLFAGCSALPGKVELSQIEADIPQDLKQLVVNGKYENLSVETIEIVKRSTEDIYDEVHCKLVMKNEKYQVDCTYVCEYQYYDVGGWDLTNNYYLTDISVSCLEDIPDVLKSLMDVPQIRFDDNYYDVQSVECNKIGPTIYELSYDVKYEEEYLNESGKYKLRYTLNSTGGMTCRWEEEEDKSGIDSTWDIVGTFTAEGDRTYAEIVIDSYNPETQEVHVASYKYEASYIWLGGDEEYNFSDMTIKANITDERNLVGDYVKELSIGIRVNDRTVHYVYFESDVAFTTPSMRLVRVE